MKLLKMIRGSRKRNNKGSVLLLTIGALFLVTMMTVTVLGITANALHLNARQRLNAEAFNIAESGAEIGLAWLRSLPSPPDQSQCSSEFAAPRTFASGTFKVTITLLTGSAVHIRTYKIVSVGTVGSVGKAIEIVVQQSSFGRYAYFTDKETMSNGNAIYWKTGEVIDGPAHSNNAGISPFNLNWQSSTAPIFQDILTSCANKITYQPSSPKNENEFKKIFKEGSKGFKLGVPSIPLPESADTQMRAAWGGVPGSLSDGVYVKSDIGGGIYVQGDAKSMEFTVDGSGNQQVIIKQTVMVDGDPQTRTTVVTADFNLDRTVVQKPDGATEYIYGLPNGVVYCDGNIKSLGGTIADNKVVDDHIALRSAWTVATNVNAGKNITITDNIVYATRPDKTLPSDDPVNLKAGTLGLVAKDIVVANNAYVKAPDNLEIDAVLLAGGQNTSGGSFYVENHTSKDVGTLKIRGGIIQKARGAVGTFSGSTTTSGYLKDYRYDPRLALNPPPFFPTTGGYERLSWRVAPVNQ